MCANFTMVYYMKYKLLPSIKEKVEFKQLSLPYYSRVVSREEK